jgi:peptide/nickel transport system ATP-binding protein
MDPLIRTENLKVTYAAAGSSDVPAVWDATFAIQPGEAVGLLGESGCGKSTTALALLRLLPPSARIRGCVNFRGRDLLQLSETDMRRIRGAQISLIFQEPAVALNPVLPVGDQIAEVLRAHRPWGRRRCRQEAEALLHQVRLADPAHPMDASRIYKAYAHELSGGQKQRVAIAQALACRPALLIADEPTTGLDTSTQAEVMALVRELKDRFSVAVLFITHHPALLAGFAERVIIMYAGRIVEHGELTEVYARPLHPYTRGLLQATPAGKKGGEGSRLVPIPGSPPDMSEPMAGCQFAPRCGARSEICDAQEPPETRLPRRSVRCFHHDN